VKQGKDTVDGYVSKYLAALSLVQDASEGEKVQRFLEGLSPSLGQKILLEDPQELERAVKMALQLQQKGILTPTSRTQDVVPMELGATQLFRLSPTEREELRRRGACFRCRGLGHVARDCPRRKNKDSSSFSSSSFASTPTSFSHPSSSQSLSPSSPPPSFSPPSFSPPSSSPPLLDPRLTTPPLRTFPPDNGATPTSPLITLDVQLPNGESVNALVDSGATNNFLSPHFAERLKLPLLPSNKNVTLADGTTLNKISFCDVPVRFSGIKDEIPCCVAPIQRPLILGMPFLRKWNPAFDWREGKIFLDRSQEALPPFALSSLELNASLEEDDQLFLALMTEQFPSIPQDEPELVKLLEEYKDIFYNDLPPGLPPDRGFEFEIHLEPGAKPPSRPPFRLSFAEQEELKNQLETLKEKGFIRPSKSPFGAPVLFVKKKDGTLRMVVDYRRLNDITVKNNYPLPLIDELFDQLGQAKYFSSMDMVSGYWQQRIAEKDIEKTAFTTKFGHFEFRVLPFGLKNAPSSFMAMVNDILRPYLNKFVLAYLDDVLIFSKTKQEHLEHLRLVFDLLRTHRLYAKPKKCDFLKGEIDFLGHKVTQQGISTSENKTQAIQDWPSPSNLSQVRSFLGLATFYQKFVKDFSSIAIPLTNLLKKDTPFSWGEEEEEAFRSLKVALTTAPVLRIIDPSLPFTLETDASDQAIGAVLSQEEDGEIRPTAFTSRKLSPAETRYPIHEKELLAIIHALRHWRHYLLDSKIKVYTDHHSLKFFQKQATVSQRQARWLDILGEYDLDIIYKPGKSNVVADALSRSLNEIVCLDSDLHQLIRKAYKKDPKTRDLLSSLEKPGPVSNYRLRDGLIYVNDKSRALYIPNDSEIKKKILWECHDSCTAGHLGLDKTLDLISREFFWPGLRKDVSEYVRSCLACQKNKPTSSSPAGLLQPLEIPSKPWDHVSLDLIIQLPETKSGFDAILVLVDKLTKMVHLAATRTTASAPDMAKLFFSNIVRLHGLPKAIISDRDARFTSHFWKALFELLGTRLAMSTAFHPQTDGQTERTNRTLEQMLRFYTSYKQDNWDDLLPALEFAINNAKQASTDYSPFFLNYGFHPNTPHGLIKPSESPVPSAKAFADEMAETFKQAKDNLLKAQQRQSRYANERRREEVFEVGEEVMLSTQNFVQESMKLRPSRKLTERFIGPFKINKMVSPVAAHLQLPESMKIHPVFHISLLKRFNKRPEHLNQPEDSPPPPIFIQDHEEYEVEKILDKKETRRGRGLAVRYLVQWKGYPLSDATWEPLSNLGNAKEAIEDYERS